MAILAVIIVVAFILLIIVVFKSQSEKVDQEILNEKVESIQKYSPDYKCLYANPEWHRQLWEGSEIIDCLKLKDGKTHQYELKKAFRSGMLHGYSHTSKRERRIDYKIFESILWKGTEYKSIHRFIAAFKDDSNADVIVNCECDGAVKLVVDNIFQKNGASFISGLNLNNYSYALLPIRKMKNIRINEDGVDADPTEIAARLKALEKEIEII